MSDPTFIRFGRGAIHLRGPGEVKTLCGLSTVGRSHSRPWRVIPGDLQCMACETLRRIFSASSLKDA